jgi:hypothetical protein
VRGRREPAPLNPNTMAGERGWSDKSKALATAQQPKLWSVRGLIVRGALASATSNRIILTVRGQIESVALLILIHWQQLLFVFRTVKALFIKAFQLFLII